MELHSFTKNFNPLSNDPMKRLSLEELKSKKAAVKKLEAIKGGTSSDCHVPRTSPPDSASGQ